MSEICPKCGLPKELCVCESIARQAQAITVRTEERKFRKKYTVIEGVDEKEVNMKDLMRTLKNKLACGGTSKGGKIELQGDHKQKAREILIHAGFPPETIEMR